MRLRDKIRNTLIAPEKGVIVYSREYLEMMARRARWERRVYLVTIIALLTILIIYGR